MANYNGKGRTNYFRVKDDEAFIEAMGNLPDVEVHQNSDGLFMVMDSHGDGGGWSSYAYDEETGEEREIDIAEEIAAHLADDEVAVIMETGSEKYRYLVGWAVAINNRGETRSISIDNIYEMAKELGDNITKAEY